MQKRNLLELKVKPPRQELQKITLPKKYKDRVPEFCKARVFRSGYHEFSGPKPDLIRMGVYGNIYLERVGYDGIQEAVMDVSVNAGLDEGKVRIDFTYFHPEAERVLEYRITDMQGSVICEGTETEHTAYLEIPVSNPRLWQPGPTERRSFMMWRCQKKEEIQSWMSIKGSSASEEWKGRGYGFFRKRQTPETVGGKSCACRYSYRRVTAE